MKLRLLCLLTLLTCVLTGMSVMTAIAEDALVSFEENRIMILGGDVFHMTEKEAWDFFEDRGYKVSKGDPLISVFECVKEGEGPNTIKFFLSKNKINRILFVDEHPGALYDSYVQLFTDAMGEPVHSDACKNNFGEFAEQNRWELGPYGITMYGAEAASLQECMEDKATLCIQFFRDINADTVK